MSKILVVGNVNVETSLPIRQFPIQYEPVRYLRGEISQQVSAVGFNVAKALVTLGHQVQLLSVIGRDLAAEQIKAAVVETGINPTGLLQLAPTSAQSVVLYDDNGRRQIHTDLQPVLDQEIPLDRFYAAAEESEIIVVTNISYGRILLPAALQLGKIIVSDVQTIADLDDEYNRPFLMAADWLFMSGEKLPIPAPEWIDLLYDRYGPELVIIGMGADGAWLGGRKSSYCPAPKIDQVKSSGGAGDALCAAFVHGMCMTNDPVQALKMAVAFASHKVRFEGSSAGYLDRDNLQRIVNSIEDGLQAANK
ncbi:MAG: carbohydrate kinase family protein [Ardenticatenaceae bacterium]|nr:carbohydrate kinase family protein [Ardenticatenaceae bacterium]